MGNFLRFLAAVFWTSTAFATGELQALKEGNERYVKGNPLNEKALSEKRKDLVQGQKPKAIIIGCSDSRVPPEIIFDQSLGDLFVVRVAGNVLADAEKESVEYAVSALKTPLIVVLGHENCAAIKAVLEGLSKEMEIEDIAQLIQPAIDQTKGQPGNPLENAIKANVGLVIEALKKNPQIKPALNSGQLEIVGGYYLLESGEVKWL